LLEHIKHQWRSCGVPSKNTVGTEKALQVTGQGGLRLPKKQGGGAFGLTPELAERIHPTPSPR
jgi:hypothetical protein